MFWGVFGPQAGRNGAWRCLESFLEAVAPSSPSMSPWGATGTPFMTFLIDLGHLLCVQTVRCQPPKNNLLHTDAQNILCCTKWPPLSNFVTFGTPGASAFMWVAFLFTGKFPAKLSVVEKHNILLLRRKTCALLRAKTSALLRRKTYAVLRARTCALFRANAKEAANGGGRRPPPLY